jgi:two-component system heavy metal sensor histidine kinase CusS
VNSFRLRLALLVGLSTAALLLAAGVLAWELTTRFNVDRLDAELHQLAKANLERVNDRSHWERLEVALGFVAGSDRSPPYVLWVKNHDRVEFRSDRWPRGLDPQSLAVPATYEGRLRFDRPPPPPRRAGISPENPGLPVRETASSTISADGSSWRVAVTGNPYTVLVIAANLDQLNLDLVRLRHRYLTILPVILLLVGAAAWWFANRALQPVAALTAATERITAADLGQRIAAPGHDREFQRLVSVFNAMLDRLETGFHQARRFSADASHELKTPLARLQAELYTRSIPPHRTHRPVKFTPACSTKSSASKPSLKNFSCSPSPTAAASRSNARPPTSAACSPTSSKTAPRWHPRCASNPTCRSRS